MDTTAQSNNNAKTTTPNDAPSPSEYPYKVFYSCTKKKKKPSAKRHAMEPINPMLSNNHQDMSMPLTPSILPKSNKDEVDRDRDRLSNRLQCIREYDEVDASLLDAPQDKKPPPLPLPPPPAASSKPQTDICTAMDAVHINHDLDATHYPQYLDGYTALSGEQKSFLSAIKRGDLRSIQHMCRHNVNIAAQINFGDCQVIRECALENRLPILKYLKQTFPDAIDLNCESGYCLRWSSRKGFIDIVRWLLYEQKFQKIDISPFQYQAIEWSVLYKHKQIAKLLQKYYNEFRLNEKWNILGNSQRNVSVEWDIFNLPSIYQDIVERIINADHENHDDTVNVIKEYYFNGCDLKFANLMPWTVAVDCTNIAILHFLYKTVGVDPLCLDNYLLRTACDIRSIPLLQFAKSVIRFELWQVKIEPNLEEYKKICHEDVTFVKELENYHQCVTPIKKKKFRNSELEQPQSPIPWPYASPYVQQKYGILTRSKKKILIKKGVLQPMQM
eukprot:CAMPEP_0202689504 /NCGR_PEP_ID=MMETSP1385-20130828/4739_1 /ASSEMBLY_ACC=CAM_ASM_000861 /TAXON_ID=933848 /ORGANISM="Elphidium margaritaceum" /LENGTH=499 /DNA_ID=CAMNT_0049344643 /DNA_START=285 /DNA_END=1784 /DNA_ORIENTATION=-